MCIWHLDVVINDVLWYECTGAEVSPLSEDKRSGHEERYWSHCAQKEVHVVQGEEDKFVQDAAEGLNWAECCHINVMIWSFLNGLATLPTNH